ncbi:diguanylate cyclase [Thermodesulfobium sp. 4217-1]|uniref:GGDEF domain-containing response regulator n=1 Tax=Thermodesulfobium sp. 4217-1 TaxID=3120013 RepID=UPI003221B5BD
MDVLLLGQSKLVSKCINDVIKKGTDFKPVFLEFFSETKDFVNKNKSNILCGVIGMSDLPDATVNEYVDYLTDNKIPLFIFSSALNENIREKFLKKGIVECINKDRNFSLDYLLRLIIRLDKDKSIKVLIVDDSAIMREYMASLLKTYNFQVIAVENAKDAIEVVGKVENIKLVLTDENMPGMRGVELVDVLRKTYSYEEMAIIGISAIENTILTKEFLLVGANDFILKPFNREEFFLRVLQNIEILELIENNRKFITTDILTGLHNINFLYEAGRKLLENAKRNNQKLMLSVIDVDNFKDINNINGHLLGDKVLKNIAKIFENRFRSGDIVVRVGAGEFCVMGIVNNDSAFNIFESLRRQIESYVFAIDGRELNLTVSIGVTTKIENNVELMLEQAYELLHKAKDLDKNKVILNVD